MFVHTLVSARGRIGGESITTQSNQLISCSIMGAATPDWSNSSELPVPVPAGNIQIPGPSSRYILLINDFSPFSHSQIPGRFEIPKIFDCVGLRTSPSSKRTFCWVRSARVHARL